MQKCNVISFTAVMSNSPPSPEDCKLPLPPPPPPPKQCKPLPPPPPPKCPKNEIYKKCGTACQPSCKNPNPICNKVNNLLLH